MVKLNQISGQTYKAVSLPSIAAVVLVHTGSILDEARRMFIDVCVKYGVHPLLMDAVDCARVLIANGLICRNEGGEIVGGRCRLCGRSVDILADLFGATSAGASEHDRSVVEEVARSAPWIIALLRFRHLLENGLIASQAEPCSLGAFIDLATRATGTIRAMTYRQWHTFWTTPMGIPYMAANIVALRRGVRLRRLFLLDENSAPRELAAFAELARVHEALNVECRVALYERFTQAVPLPCAYFSSMGDGQITLFDMGADGIRCVKLQDSRLQREMDYLYDQIFDDCQITMDTEEFLDNRPDVAGLCNPTRVAGTRREILACCSAIEAAPIEGKPS